MIPGPAKCDKISKLEPLEYFFKCFPIHLMKNMPDLLQSWQKRKYFKTFHESWSDLLERLTSLCYGRGGEGIVKLASSKNQYLSNACINWDIFMVARSKSKTAYFRKHNSRDTRSNKMIVARRKNMNLSTNVTSKCFFEFILLGDADWYYRDIHIATYLLVEEPLSYFLL